jgi:uncharacterized protein (DUF302 family)
MRVLDPNHRHPFSSGIPVILAAPIIAVDLSLLVLVWEGSQGRTWLSYNNPEYLKTRHSVRKDLVKNIGGRGGG